jgi:hypothetical protein
MARVDSEYSHWPEEHPELCVSGESCGEARCVKCDGGAWDVVECSKCGKQRTVPCTFDEDYS